MSSPDDAGRADALEAEPGVHPRDGFAARGQEDRLGAADTGTFVEHALGRGVETVFLSAGSEAIARVYARLGFRRVGTACIVG